MRFSMSGGNSSTRLLRTGIGGAPFPKEARLESVVLLSRLVGSLAFNASVSASLSSTWSGKGGYVYSEFEEFLHDAVGK